MRHWLDLPVFSNNELLQRILKSDRRNRELALILPDRTVMFRAFSLTPWGEVRVCVLGQDPYPNPLHAMGLAFSIPAGLQPIPQSLQNIFKELKDDVGIEATDGSLIPWARKGVFLLNAALTVEAGKPGSHEGMWAVWVSQVLKILVERKTIFVLLGTKARKVADKAEVPKELRIEAVHPSPLSANGGFFGSRIFTRVNNLLRNKHEEPIDWSLSLPTERKIESQHISAP